VGGFDARSKLAILMRLALRVVVDPEEIVPQSITAISAVDFSYARDLGCTIRQVARAQRNKRTVTRSKKDKQQGCRSQLGWSVVTDLVGLAHGSRRVGLPAGKATVAAVFEVPHYIRSPGDGRPGILSEIT